MRPLKDTRRRAKRWMTALALAMFAGVAVAEQRAAGELDADQLERVEEIIGESCVFCHGERGEASNPLYPRLAAQNPAYIERQLKLFRSGARKSEVMNVQAADLSDEDIRLLARFFATQPPRAHRLAADEQERLLAGVGEYVFKYGDPHGGIPPCMTCHGRAGQGSRDLPRLAGQHRMYLVAQLRAFASGKRRTDHAIMRSVASRLSPLAMQGVALYLSTLAPELGGQ